MGKTRIWSIERRLFVLIFILFFLFILMQISKYQIHFVSGDSMLPTYSSGDKIIIDREASPSKGDIVLLNFFLSDMSPSVKRVIYDHSDGFAYALIDVSADTGEVIYEFLTKEQADILGEKVEVSSVPLGPDDYIVIGDNQGVSYDSRHFGIITRNQIIGVVVQQL